MQEPEGLNVGFIFPDCSMEGKTPTLSHPCKTSPVNKHHTHNQKQPTLKCLSFIIQTDFPNRVQAKTQMKLSADKGSGIMTGCVLFTLLTHLRSHTDFAQRFPHHYVEVSLLLLLHHNLLLSDQEEPLLIPYHNLVSQCNS